MDAENMIPELDHMDDMLDFEDSFSSFLEVDLQTELSSQQITFEEKPCPKCSLNDTNSENNSVQCRCNVATEKVKAELKTPRKRGRPKKILSDDVEDSFSRVFICEYCTKGFKTKNQLKIHSVVHTDIKSHPCTLCDKSFKLKQQLKVHIKTHEETKPFVCEVCKKTFKLKQQLDNHLRTHSDARPYDCSFCGKNFKFKQQLHIHLRVHDDFRPFTCEHCTKAFKLKQQLQFHERVHTDVRPYSCNYCDKSFKFKQQLQLHSKVHVKDGDEDSNPVSYVSESSGDLNIKHEQVEDDLYSEFKSEENGLSTDTSKDGDLSNINTDSNENKEENDLCYNIKHELLQL